MGTLRNDESRERRRQQMLAKMINNDKGVTRLMVGTMLVACIAVAGLVAAADFSSEENNTPVYAGMSGNGALELRDAVIARGDGTQVSEVVFTVAIPDGADPVNFTAPPDNVVTVSYVDDQQQVDNLDWAFAQYGPGDWDNMLEKNENFRMAIQSPDPGAGGAFNIEIKTPDGKVLTIGRALPDEMKPVMNLK